MSTAKSTNRVKVLVECAVMVALATVLSLIKLYELPYGGSVTAASMLPILIIAYRHGTGVGLGTALVYGVIQQLLGINTLGGNGFTWVAIVAVSEEFSAKKDAVQPVRFFGAVSSSAFCATSATLFRVRLSGLEFRFLQRRHLYSRFHITQRI